MEVIKGIIEKAQKCLIYGPEGIGKSTFAAQFPNPVFIDTEGSTNHMNVARLPVPTSWTMLMEEVRYVKANPSICKTLAIDTADWAERLCADEICAKSKKIGIEDFGYGKGYTYLEEEFGRLLNLLNDVRDVGVNIVCTAHAQMRKFEQPDEMGAYDRWELKLEKKTAPLLKEWADMVLFANYKTYVINIDNQGAAKGKNKAQGGNRVMYTSHHACWDAKNRHDLPEELEFNFSTIAHCIPGSSIILTQSTKVEEKKELPISSPTQETQENNQHVATPETKVDPKPEQPEINKKDPPKFNREDLSGVPKPLADLMMANNVTINEIQKATSSKGYYPVDTPITNYDPGFISGVLVAAWHQVFQMIKNIREEARILKEAKEDMPFK